MSEEALQVHAAVEVRDRVGVPVEGQGGAARELPDAALAGLAPARMIDLGVHVGVKAVFFGAGAVPSGARLLLDEADFYDRFGAFEAVLPRYYQAQRRAVLPRQGRSVQAQDHER